MLNDCWNSWGSSFAKSPGVSSVVFGVRIRAFSESQQSTGVAQSVQMAVSRLSPWMAKVCPIRITERDTNG
jgi:hypothetical protein